MVLLFKIIKSMNNLDDITQMDHQMDDDSKFNKYIFTTPEIEKMIFDELNPFVDYRNIMLISKYYHEMFFDHPIILELKKFYGIRAKDPTIRDKYKTCRRTGLINPGYDTCISKNYIDEQLLNFAKACINGCIIIAKYIYSKYTITMTKETHWEIFRRSCVYGHLEIVKFLHSLNLELLTNINFTNINFETIFKKSCKKGHLNIAMWSHSFVSFKPHNVLFLNVCRNGHIEVARFLLSVDNLINIHANNEYMFRISCSNGDLNSVKFLVLIDGKIDTHILNDDALYNSCINGHTEVVKFLYTLDNNNSTFIKKRKIFERCCENGHLGVVKFLYENCGDVINIREHNDRAFRIVYFRKKQDIAKWMASIYSGYKIYTETDRYGFWKHKLADNIK